MTKQVPFIPKPGQNGQKPLIDKEKVEAMKKLRETIPAYLFRGIRKNRAQQWEQIGLFTDSLDDVYQAILTCEVFDIFSVGGPILTTFADADPRRPQSEFEWKKLAEGWQTNKQREADLKILSDLKAKYPDA